MLYKALADIVVLIHFVFIIFVIFGGILVFRWRWVSLVHIPAAFWGILIEFTGWICPLTPLENEFRMKGGDADYESGFIEHYIMPIIYPEVLTRTMQIIFGLSALVVNACIYGWVVYKKFARAQ